MGEKRWDVFISHASEDKDAIANPLAEALEKHGLNVWYDDFTLTLGDSLRRSIDRGIAESRHGIVILSPHFFAKEWTQRELDALAAIEVDGDKLILPIWHNVSRQDVARFSPTLADRVSVSTSKGINAVVYEILRIAKPELTLRATSSELRPLNLTKDRPRIKNKEQALFKFTLGHWDDYKAESSLIKKLKSAKDPVSQYLRKRFSDEMQILLSRLDTDKPYFFPEDDILSAVTDELNKIIQGPCIYEETRFSWVTLTEKTKKLLNENPKGEELVLLNRWLIADTYFRELEKDQYKDRYLSFLDVLEVFAYTIPLMLGAILFILGIAEALGYTKPEFYLAILPWKMKVLIGAVVMLLSYSFFQKRDPKRNVELDDLVNGPRKVLDADLGGSRIGEATSFNRLIFSQVIEPLQIKTERLEKKRVSETDWELRVCCGLFNCSTARAIVFDAHANEYAYKDFFIPYLLTAGNRPEVITLYSDNSIFKGMTYEIPGGCYRQVEFVFTISREFPGSMIYAFGILVDYHLFGGPNSGKPKKLRTTSNEIYFFQYLNTKSGHAEFNYVGEVWANQVMRLHKRKKAKGIVNEQQFPLSRNFSIISVLYMRSR